MSHPGPAGMDKRGFRPNPPMPTNLFQDRRVMAGLLVEIASLAEKAPEPVRLMEVCGTHTMTIHRHGLKDLLRRAGVEMISGPGCPV